MPRSDHLLFRYVVVVVDVAQLTRRKLVLPGQRPRRFLVENADIGRTITGSIGKGSVATIPGIWHHTLLDGPTTRYLWGAPRCLQPAERCGNGAQTPRKWR